MKRYLGPIKWRRNLPPRAPLLCMSDFAVEIGVPLNSLLGKFSQSQIRPKATLVTQRRTNLVNFYIASELRAWWKNLNRSKP